MWGDSLQTQKERYDAVMHDLQMIGQRNMLCGMHVHVELPDPDARVDLMYRMLPYLPLFLALSTSSPFWQSRRTGLKGYRLAAYDELPRTGVPELFRTKEEFDAYVAALVKAGVMEDSSYVWWAIRPSLKHPTLELRAPDCCTLLDDTLAIAALYRTLARHLYNNPWRNADMNAVSRAIVVENKWRAQRYGVHGTFVAEEGAVTVAEMLDRLIEETATDIDALECSDRDQALPGHRGGRHLGRRAACGLRGASQGRQPRQRAARGHRLDRERHAAIAPSRMPAMRGVAMVYRALTASTEDVLAIQNLIAGLRRDCRERYAAAGPQPSSENTSVRRCTIRCGLCVDPGQPPHQVHAL